MTIEQLIDVQMSFLVRSLKHNERRVIFDFFVEYE